jgi:solute carrier family 25 phosphate transporter 23/24/25/41
VSRTVTSPLERLKVLRQCASVEYAHLSMWDSMIKFYKLEGMKGYFKGNGTNVLRIVPFSALEFYVFEICKGAFMNENDPKNKLRLVLCGSIAGIIASLCTYPLDIVKTLLTLQTEVSRGLWGETVHIFNREGIKGLYRGLNMTLIGIAPFIGIKMATFDTLKEWYLPDRNDPKFPVYNLYLGGIAGAVAATITYPADLIRKKLQMKAFDIVKDVPYDNISECCRYTYQKEGVAGFFRGMAPNILKVVPTIAIAFSCNEQLKKWFGVESH